MTSSDFDEILYGSIPVETKQGYFNVKKDLCCSITFEYARGLINAFKRAFKIVNEIDYDRYKVTKPNGDYFTGAIADDLDPEYREQLLNESANGGEISFPFKKQISYFYNQGFSEKYRKITYEMVCDIWPELKFHLFSLIQEIKIADELLANEQIQILKKAIAEIDEISFSTSLSDVQIFLKASVSGKRDFDKKNKSIKPQPKFKSENLEEIFNILKDRFSEQDQILLSQVLKTGEIPASKLLFLGNGKTLLDFFKQLMNGHFLVLTVQRDFEFWVSDAFEYLKNGSPCKITPKYASMVISGTERAAIGKRLIDVVPTNNGFEIKLLELKSRKQEKKLK